MNNVKSHKMDGRVKVLTFLVIVQIFVLVFQSAAIRVIFKFPPIFYTKSFYLWTEIFYLIVLFYWMMLLTQELNTFFNTKSFIKCIYIVFIPSIILTFLRYSLFNSFALLCIGVMLSYVVPWIYLWAIILYFKAFKKINVTVKDTKINLMIVGLVIQIIGIVVREIMLYILIFKVSHSLSLNEFLLVGGQLILFVCIGVFYITMIIGIKTMREINFNKQ